MTYHLDIIIATLGGLGLFLLGMVIMTEGLRALAGDALRASLMRYTRTPLSGALAGAACTAVLQSSSATTVAAVGFVGAELMSFSNALGIIFGANIGTTITGWLVALVGFKLKLHTLALPLVLCGALLRLLSRGRSADIGYALAGFALIFIGIDTLQGGLRDIGDSFSFAALPATTLFDQLRLVGLGAAFTIVTQSSSAAVATTLTALNAGMIDLPQAGCLVIGADIGTTATAALATLGASTEARRTGWSHVVYNLLTGAMALVVLPGYLYLAQRWAPQWVVSDPEFLLVGFHSAFNVLGVLLILPFSAPFARLLRRLVPRRADEIVAGLDEALLAQPKLALNVAHKAVERLFVSLLHATNRALDAYSDERAVDFKRVQVELDEVHDYVAAIDLRGTRDGEWDRLLALLHALDHLQRLHERLDEDAVRGRNAQRIAELEGERRDFLVANAVLADAIANSQWERARKVSAEQNEKIRLCVTPFRAATAAAMAARSLSLEAGTERLEAVRWLRRVGRHVARISFHLDAAAQAAGR